MYRVNAVTKELQKHDKDLFAKQIGPTVCVYRKVIRHERYDVDGDTIVFARPDAHLIWALTDNWSITGSPVDWGLEPLRARLSKHDTWQNEKFVDDINQSYERDAASQDRAADTAFEGLASELRHAVKKDLGHVNVSTLNRKTDKRRIKDGYRK